MGKRERDERDEREREKEEEEGAVVACAESICRCLLLIRHLPDVASRVHVRAEHAETLSPRSFSIVSSFVCAFHEENEAIGTL